MKALPDDPKDDETEEVVDTPPEEGLESLLVLQAMTSTTEKKWLRDNIFRSNGTVNCQDCTVVIDGGSCQNLIS